MNRSFRAILLPIVFFVCTASAGELDPRFDGKWSGVETFSWRSGGTTIKSQSPNTVIAIAEHGKVIGVLAGWIPGRYAVSPESRGSTLVYRTADVKRPSAPHREESKLVLSSDGQTLEETGHAILTFGIANEPTPCRV